MPRKARFLGVNHVAIEVGDVEEALEFYGNLFELELRGRGPGMAFVDAGDQFIAISERASESRAQPPDEHRHLGLVVDNKEAVRRALRDMGVEVAPGGGVDFSDPWGNRWQVVEYGNVQFTKATNVLRGMGIGHLRKNERALRELESKGMAPG